MSTQSSAFIQDDRAWRAARSRRLARLLDGCCVLPGLGVRVGLDPLLGLWPIWGDLIGAGLGLIIVYDAWRLGVPRTVLARMIANLAIDAAGGFVPVLGDLLDVGFKANMQNITLAGMDDQEG